MRLILTILMTVAQLLGPWLCCCGPTLMTAAVRQSVGEGRPKSATGGCPHCHKEQAPAREHAPTSPKVPDRCPCGGILSVAVPAEKPEVPTVDGLLVVVAAELTQVLPLEPAPPRSPTGLRDLPLLTTADRLFAHHVLRC